MQQALAKPLTDEQLSKMASRMALKVKIFGLLTVAFATLALCPRIIIMDVPILIILASLQFCSPALAFLFVFLTKRSRDELKKIIGNNILSAILADLFNVNHYSPTAHIVKEAVTRAGLIETKKWEKIKGSDLVEGTYRGVGISFSNIHLFDKKWTGTGKDVTIFRGQWLILHLAKDIPHGLKLIERGFDNKTAKSDIETENMEFNKKFEIIASDPHTAFYVLTPHFMEYIMSADRQADARTYINIRGKEIHIALHSGRDLFDVSKNKMRHVKMIPALRAQMRRELRYITGIIDEFLLNENLFDGKEEK